MSVNIDNILLEWSYKCRKGYPEMEDGKFTNINEIELLNELLLPHGLSYSTSIVINESIPKQKPPITISKPHVASNDTAIKEGLVCMFFDCFKDSNLKDDILELQELKRSKIGKGADISKHEKLNSILNSISDVFRANVSNYGTGNSSVKSLDEYVKWVWLTGEDLNTLNNAISAANTIHTKIIKSGTVIRNKDFEDIRSLAVILLKQDYNINLTEDNWCPGDIYIVVNHASLEKALSSTSLNVEKGNLNSNFTKSKNLIAISLKEQEAQAGKASTFADTVFSKDYKSNVSKKDLTGTTAENKSAVKVSASIARYLDYLYGGKIRKKSYVNAISKHGKIHKTVNIILSSTGKHVLTSKDINFGSSDEQEFYNNNKNIFDSLSDSVKQLKEKYTEERQVKKTIKRFVNSRTEFVQNLQKFNVEIDTIKSATLATSIETKMKDNAVKVMSMKTSTYELASLIINKWVNDIESISPAYQKISVVTNPFVALTAFALAEAGVSPSYWKVVGSERGILGDATFFDSNDIVDIDTKMSPIKLYDSPGQSGFQLVYITSVGAKRFKTKLTFRFANDTIRIEVEKLIAI